VNGWRNRERAGALTRARAGRVARGAMLLLWAAFAGMFLPSRALAQVLLVLSDDSSGYQSVATELRSGLKTVRDGKLRIDTAVAARLASDAPKLDAYELVVPVGLAAAQAVVSREEGLPTPPRTLCLLIPRQSFAQLAARRRDERLSALYIDQPLARQLDLLHLALPQKKRIGVIFGPSSQELDDELRSEARTHELELSSVRIDQPSGLYGALQTVIPASDLLLMLPDPVAANADSVYGLMLTAYRAELPVMGFSEGLFNAGALVSLFSTARQQGREGAEIAARTLAAGGALPAPQYPRYFTVRVNANVARSLGLHPPAAESLSAALEAQRDNVRAPDGANTKPGGQR
jgi:ABC-type uncharacterized transport system substrate-binding protein